MGRTRGMAAYRPSDAYLAIKPEMSGNVINGLGETEPRRASPSFWHPPDLHPFGAVREMASESVRVDPAVRAVFAEAHRHPPLAPIAPRQADRTAAEWTEAARAFALSHEADLFGAVPMQDHYIVAGYEIAERNVIVLGVAHDYDKIRKLPSTAEETEGVMDVGVQYARGTRSSFALANWIRAQGFSAHAYPGPKADALLLIPPAIDAGLGELGKHGSLINRTYGSGFRLAGVTTDMPLACTQPDVFGADDFCTGCQVCTNACPPGAIGPEKQTVRGVEKWYVDFDLCIPYFAENAACGLCIAVCPWTRPGVGDGLLSKMARRRARAGALLPEGTPAE